MNRLDRLIIKAKPKPSLYERLKVNNPYMDQSYQELIDYLDAENHNAPERGTWAWSQYISALMETFPNRNCGGEV